MTTANTTTSTSPNDFNIPVRNWRGTRIPALGMGTYELTGSECEGAVENALELGYRHIDTARMYGNEKEVGAAIHSSTVPRDDLFVTSKIWYEDLEPDDLRRQLDASLKDLKMDYLDLLLIHWPNPEIKLGKTLQAMADAVEQKLIRNIGVSNFPSDLMEKAYAITPILTNQVEYHPYLSQNTLVKKAEELDVFITAYSPLGQDEILNDSVLTEIAEEHGVTSAQVSLQWLLRQSRVIAIPRSSSRDHLKANLNVFDFELSESELKRIDDLPKDRRLINPDFAPDWDKD